MEQTALTYLCPDCMAYLRYDGKEQKWVCDYCGGKFTREELEQRGAETKQDDYEIKPRAEAAENTAEISYHYEENITETDEDLSHLRAYHCPSNGGNLLCFLRQPDDFADTAGGGIPPLCDSAV